MDARTLRAGEVPPLFTRVPPGLFGPLTGAFAPLYWTILSVYYHYEFEREPFFLLKSVVLDTAEELIRESPVWAERRQELIASPEAGVAADEADDETALLRGAARRAVSRLESEGWFHFEYRSGIGEVLNFHPYAARILDALVRVARDEQPVFQGYAHSIASLLKPDVFAARPGVSLSEAKRNALDLVRELKILNRNIYASTQRLLDEAATAAGVLEEASSATGTP